MRTPASQDEEATASYSDSEIAPQALGIAQNGLGNGC
jgi:hypothetical protein